MFLGCTYIEPDDSNIFNTIDIYVAAVEKGDSVVASEALTTDSQMKLDRNVISTSNGDFDVIIKAFKRAGVSTRGNRSKDEISVKVSKLRGIEANVKFVMVKEGDQWKIANILED